MRLHPYTGEPLTAESLAVAYEGADATLRWLLDHLTEDVPELREARELVVKAARARLTGRIVVDEKGERHVR